MVFATGIMLQDEHLEDLGQQTIYGIWDRQTIDGTMLAGESFTPVSDTQLEERTDIPASRASNGGFFYYAISGDAIDWETQRGWFIHMNNVHQEDNALRGGERSIADVQNFGRSVIITSTVLRPPPEGEMCTIADLPANYVYIVNAQNASPSGRRGRSRVVWNRDVSCVWDIGIVLRIWRRDAGGMPGETIKNKSVSLKCTNTLVETNVWLRGGL